MSQKEIEIEWRRRLSLLEAQRILLQVIRGQANVIVENYRIRNYGDVHRRLGEYRLYDNYQFNFDTFAEYMRLIDGPLCSSDESSTKTRSNEQQCNERLISFVKLTTCFHHYYYFDRRLPLEENNRYPRIFCCKRSVEIDESSSTTTKKTTTTTTTTTAATNISNNSEEEETISIAARITTLEDYEMDRSDNNLGIKFVHKVYIFTADEVRICLYAVLDEFGNVRYEIGVEKELTLDDDETTITEPCLDTIYRAMSACSAELHKLTCHFDYVECPIINLTTGWLPENNPTTPLRSLCCDRSVTKHAKLYETFLNNVIGNCVQSNDKETKKTKKKQQQQQLKNNSKNEETQMECEEVPNTDDTLQQKEMSAEFLLKFKIDGVKFFAIFDGTYNLCLNDGSTIDLRAVFRVTAKTKDSSYNFHRFFSTHLIYQLERVIIGNDVHYFITDVAAVRNQYATVIQAPLHTLASTVQRYRKQAGQEWPFNLIGTDLSEQDELIDQLAKAQRERCCENAHRSSNGKQTIKIGTCNRDANETTIVNSAEETQEKNTTGRMVIDEVQGAGGVVEGGGVRGSSSSTATKNNTADNSHTDVRDNSKLNNNTHSNALENQGFVPITVNVSKCLLDSLSRTLAEAGVTRLHVNRYVIASSAVQRRLVEKQFARYQFLSVYKNLLKLFNDTEKNDRLLQEQQRDNKMIVELVDKCQSIMLSRDFDEIKSLWSDDTRQSYQKRIARVLGSSPVIDFWTNDELLTNDLFHLIDGLIVYRRNKTANLSRGRARSNATNVRKTKCSYRALLSSSCYNAFKLKTFQTIELMYTEETVDNEDRLITQCFKTDDFYRKFYFQRRVVNNSGTATADETAKNEDVWKRFDMVDVHLRIPNKFLPLVNLSIYEILCENEVSLYLIGRRSDKCVPDSMFKVNSILFAREPLQPFTWSSSSSSSVSSCKKRLRRRQQRHAEEIIDGRPADSTRKRKSNVSVEKLHYRSVHGNMMRRRRNRQTGSRKEATNTGKTRSSRKDSYNSHRSDRSDRSGDRSDKSYRSDISYNSDNDDDHDESNNDDTETIDNVSQLDRSSIGSSSSSTLSSSQLSLLSNNSSSFDSSQCDNSNNDTDASKQDSDDNLYDFSDMDDAELEYDPGNDSNHEDEENLFDYEDQVRNKFEEMCM